LKETATLFLEKAPLQLQDDTNKQNYQTQWLAFLLRVQELPG
jgi:hypothetical protein